MLIREQHGSVGVVRLNHGKVNALNLELCQELASTLNDLEKTSTIKAVVLTGTGTTFSAGVDLWRLIQEDQIYTRKFVPTLVKLLELLFLFPKPIVIAINGHAIAGGCVIACAGDYRIGVKGEGKIGVSEALVGVPFPRLAFEIIRFAVCHHRLQEIVYFGRYYDMNQGLDYGLVDETVPREELLPRSMEIATKLIEIPADTFRILKHQLRQPYVDAVERSKQEEEEIYNIWGSDQTRANVREYLRRTVGK